ncbi:MAG: hypothetical protein KAI44_04440 [Methylococcales bacterium]|nr:hypothetical protein [Methylococcales bacterium]MCK5478142.1 hypothetical protein [Methylococcales bacterium]
MGCCDDPTEPVKINRSDLVRAQEQYGSLVRDLFTGDPEKVMLKQLRQANTYLTELAALNAHYDSVRIHAIEVLKKESITVLQRIVDKEADSEVGLCAKQRIENINE